MKLTCIVINYNDAMGLKRAPESTAMQTCQDFEHVFVGGRYPFLNGEGCLYDERATEKVTPRFNNLPLTDIWVGRARF